jgi:hypothetical protein
MFGNAEAYERFMGRWSSLVSPLLVDFANLPARGRVLDVGSGTGSLAIAIAERKPNARVLGIDPSKEYVAYAASKSPFADRVRRATKPGGTISAAVWDYPAGMRMLRIFWDAAAAIDPAAEKRDEKHMPLCRSGELSRLWKEGGLQNVHEQPLDIKTQFLSFVDYWDAFLLGQGPAGAYAASLDRAKQQALRCEVKRRLALSAEDRPFNLPARVWAVRGTVL